MLEVETPLLGSAGTTDLQIESFVVKTPEGDRYLQTSPEFFLKRLLVQHGRSIFSLGKVFRCAEQGRWHNPEFSMLEWYRVGFDLNQIMDDTIALVRHCLGQPELRALKVSYRSLFERHFQIDPHSAGVNQLQDLVTRHTSYQSVLTDRNEGLQLLMSQVIEPGFDRHLTLVHDFPVGQAALARIHQVEGQEVAARFELYYGALELANGYYELTDADEQALRFEQDRIGRVELGLPAVPADHALIEAMRLGLPDCAGVSIGLDRLLAVQLGANNLESLLPFDWNQS